MVIIVYTGIFFILLSVVVNLLELKKFFKALSILNNNSDGFGNKMLYSVRFARYCLPKLAPIIPDVIVMFIGGMVGLNGGFYGFILGTAGSCILTLGIKLMLKLNKKKSSSGDLHTQMISI